MFSQLRPFLLCLLLSIVALSATQTTSRPAAAADQPAYTLTSVGSLGGNSTALTVDTGIAYLAEGAKLAIIDVHNLDQPRRLTSLPLPAVARDIVVANGWAYLALGAQDLLILDVHNPLTPGVRARLSLPGEAAALDVLGATVYVAAGNGGLQIVDVGDTARPVLRGSFITGAAQDVFVNGSFAYVADGDGGLHTIDVRNPAQPTLRATHPAQAVQAVRVIGGRAYMLAGAGLNPDLTPRITLQTATVEAAPGGAQSDTAPGGCLNIVGSYAYTCVDIYDIRNPQQLTLVSAYPLSLRLPHTAVDVVGGFVYLAGAGLKILDVRNPATPVLRSTVPAPLYVSDVALAGNLAYIADFDNGWQIVDVSNPAEPRVLSQNSLEATTIEVVGNRAYVGAGALHIFDVSDPAHPVKLVSYSVENGVTGVLVIGTRAYVDTSLGVQILDVSDPQDIEQLSYTKIANGGVTGFDVSGDLLYLATPFDGLQIYDISDPAHPALLKSVAVAGLIEGVTIVGDRAYLRISPWILRIYDLSDPLTPVAQGSYSAPTVLYRVEIIDHLALLALANGIQIVNVSDPANPVLLSTTAIPGGARALAVAGQLVAIGPDRPSEGQGVQLLRLLPVTQRLFLPQLSQ